MILTENNNANIHHIPTINVVITDGDTKVLNGIQDNILLNTINNTTTTTSSFKNNKMKIVIVSLSNVINLSN